MGFERLLAVLKDMHERGFDVAEFNNIIIEGLAGAGKTVLILKLTAFLRELCGSQKSVAVLAQRGVVARLNEGSTLASYIDSAVMEGTAR